MGPRAPMGPQGPPGAPRAPPGAPRAPQRGGGMYGVIFIAMGWLKLVAGRPPTSVDVNPILEVAPGERQPIFKKPRSIFLRGFWKIWLLRLDPA